MDDRNEILKRLQIAYNNLYCSQKEILTEETNLNKDLQLDSLNILEFTSKIEKEFDITFIVDEEQIWETVSDIICCIDRRIISKEQQIV